MASLSVGFLWLILFLVGVYFFKRHDHWFTSVSQEVKDVLSDSRKSVQDIQCDLLLVKNRIDDLQRATHAVAMHLMKLESQIPKPAPSNNVTNKADSPTERKMKGPTGEELIENVLQDLKRGY